MTARERIAQSGPPVVAPIDGKKAARYNASSMLLPSPAQVRDAISAIPAGSSKTLVELREELAAASGAGVTCPRGATLCWYLIAQAAEADRAEGVNEVTPWWRITRDRKPDPKLPGGAANHRALLKGEGIEL